VSARIRDRFATTHDIETITQQARSAADFPIRTAYATALPQEDLAAAVDEGRPVAAMKEPMLWYWMTPKGSGG
jgi:hypothetical protein